MPHDLRRDFDGQFVLQLHRPHHHPDEYHGHRNGDLDAPARHHRGRRTGTGSGADTFNETVANGESRYDTTFVPANGAVLLNNATGNSLTFVSGEVRESSAINIASGAFVLYNVEYRALTFSVGNATVVFDGAMMNRPGAGGSITSTGEVLMRVAGTTAARIFYNAQGKLSADVSAPVPAW